ncbi:ribose 5-phosphate isomerase B [Syntrophomonas palmitatica]|uniref:ribose 5-phosphate isomerase B n=1 Tax=Syntrophomonas palmitatica TaxID=402877 RepID=UPI0006D0FDE7|nr:ribose 5-phosphate isomerase B [Syntrophomonas palmitatica]
MKIAIGSDHAGFQLKEEIIQVLQAEKYSVVDCGSFSAAPVDYPDIAEQVVQKVLSQRIPGILICGTGIGISIAANKFAGIRAALCHDTFSARLAREHNDANILAIGARITGPGLAAEIVKTFLAAEFAGDRHQKRLDKISLIENKYMERS